MLSTTTEDDFADLPAAGNGSLRGHPNHIMINGDIFLMANGAPNLRAKSFAMKIIDFLRIVEHDDDHEDDDTDNEEMTAVKAEASAGAETLLAMLWASENGGLTPIHLQDVPDNGSLNQIIRNVKSKLSTRVLNGPVSVPTGDTDTPETGEATAWAVSSQSIVQELNRMHESREAERARKEQNMSLLKTLNPSQKELFTNLCKSDFMSDPVMSPFMTTLIMTSSPQKAIGVLKVEAGDWEGTFSEGCCHRFLSNGFLSLEASRGIPPGGFTVFMFHPKTIDIGGKAFDTHTATLREYFDLDVEDATIAYYAKQGFFHPTNPHDLRIQLEAAMEMLELLTCITRSQPTGCITS